MFLQYRNSGFLGNLKSNYLPFIIFFYVIFLYHYIYCCITCIVRLYNKVQLRRICRPGINFFGFCQRVEVIFRSSCLEMFCEKGILKSCTIFIGKHLCWSLFLIKFQLTPLRIIYHTYLQQHIRTKFRTAWFN